MRIETKEKQVYRMLMEGVLQHPFCSLVEGEVSISVATVLLGEYYYVQMEVFKKIPRPITPEREWATCGGYVPIEASDQEIIGKINSGLASLAEEWVEGLHP